MLPDNPPFAKWLRLPDANGRRPETGALSSGRMPPAGSRTSWRGAAEALTGRPVGQRCVGRGRGRVGGLVPAWREMDYDLPALRGSGACVRFGLARRASAAMGSAGT